MGLPGSSASKESTCNAGDPGSISRSGRSTGKGIGYPPQYSSASLVAQLVKNLPARWETWVWSLGREDPLEKEMATHSSTLAWRIPWTEEPGAWGRQRVRHGWIISLSLSSIVYESLAGSAGKESACKVGDLGLIPGLGRFPGEGQNYPLQYSGLENSWTMGCKELEMTERLPL